MRGNTWQNDTCEKSTFSQRAWKFIRRGEVGMVYGETRAGLRSGGNLAFRIKRVVRRIPGLRQAAIYARKTVATWRFRRAYHNAYHKEGDVRLHVGAGTVHIDGWLNTDVSSDCPLFLDATRRFPVMDDSVSYIFTEYCIEHMPRHGAITFFKESFRVLKPGGILRFITPDVEALASAYLKDPERVRLLNERNRWHGYKYHCYPVDILNKAFLEDGHVCLYDAQTLEQLLSSVGYQNITRCKVGQSCHAALSAIERHDVGSTADEFACVIEASKPLLA